MPSAGFLALCLLISHPAARVHALSPQDTLARAVANDNRRSGGTLRNNVLNLRLHAARARWYPEQEDGPSLTVDAFGEEGRAVSVPGPMIRVAVGTQIISTIRNALEDTLLVSGLSGSPADTIRIAPGATVETRTRASAPGTFAYSGATVVNGKVLELGNGKQLLGAYVVDSANPRPDRVFVISVWKPEPEVPAIFVLAMNGKSWPHTERIELGVGDSLHWRLINGSDARHPMHLHGFYFRIDARGSWTADTMYSLGQRRMVVTESLPFRGTFSMTWRADEPGNWLFHCHDVLHTNWRRRYNLMGRRAAGMQEMHTGADHAEKDMAGLVLGIHVRAGTSPSTRATGSAGQRARIFINQKPGHYGNEPAFSFVRADPPRDPAPDSLNIPARALVLTRGQRAQVTLINRLSIATSVHWHGIELESYYDGVAGFGGSGTRRAPLIMPGDSFMVHFTPPRAGTFIYHSHVDDLRQIPLGLYGALLVLEPGQRYDPATDHVLLISQLGRGQSSKNALNGTAAPAPLELRAGVNHRLRFINITTEDDADVRLMAGATEQSWRPLAKDGRDLPSASATVRAAVTIVPGETYDFQVNLPLGDYELRIKSFNEMIVQVHVR